MIDLHLRSKKFCDVEILKNIHLSLPQGKCSVFLGPSGCGKTTLMNLIGGLDTDYDGTIKLLSTKIGMIFQEPRLLAWLSVEENLKLVNPQANCEQLLKEVGIQTERHKRAAHLSLGMARRVAFARALAVKPEILMMDEPFVSLDQSRSKSMRLMVLDLMSRFDFTTVFVTHDPVEAVQLGHDLYFMGTKPGEAITKTTLDLTRDQRRCEKTVQEVAQTLFPPSR